MPGPAVGPVHSQDSGDSSVILVSPAASVSTEILVVTGAAGTRSVAIEAIGLPGGSLLTVQVQFPTTSGIVLVFRSGSPSGPIIDTIQSDGSGNWATLDLYLDNGFWEYLRSQMPA